MRIVTVTITCILLAYVFTVKCEHLVLGHTDNKHIIHHAIVQYNAIPFTKRVKNYFYNSPDQWTINSIVAYDNLHSKASANVTAGGIGFTYVNLRMKSERGMGLDYDIGIYSELRK